MISGAIGIIFLAFFIAPFFKATDAWAKGGGGSSSSSSSNTSTSTVSQDNRVAADSGGVALGQQATLDINNSFSDNVKQAFSELVGLAQEAGQQAVNFSQAAIQANENAANQVAAQAQVSVDAANQGNAVLIKQLAPYIVVAVIGVFFIVYYFGKAKR